MINIYIYIYIYILNTLKMERALHYKCSFIYVFRMILIMCLYLIKCYIIRICGEMEV
jgi:hypothetical protein